MDCLCTSNKYIKIALSWALTEFQNFIKCHEQTVYFFFKSGQTQPGNFLICIEWSRMQ